MQVNEDKPYDDINITPMLDLAYVLVVIFIIMTTASVQGMKVDLPHGSSTQTLVTSKTKLISITNSGLVSIDAVPVSMAELESKLRSYKATIPDVSIVVKGDRAVQYQKIMDVLDICGNVGISSVGLATQRSPGS
jgi:biopolymer transport protein ExbD